MSVETLLRLSLAPALIGVNAFFVAVEFALTRLSSLELTDADVEDSAGLRRARSMLDRLEIHLTGCQLGISASSVLLGVLAEPAVTSFIEPAVGGLGLEGSTVSAVSVGVSVVLLNLAHKIWGEQAPTYLGVERPRQVAERLAPILFWWTRIMRPIIRLGDGAAKWTLGLFGVEITRSWAEGDAEGDPDEPGGTERGDLKSRMADLLTTSPITRDRREEVLASLEIDELPGSNVMVPLEDAVVLALDVPGRENLRRIGQGGHTRYPVLRTDAPLDRRLTVPALAGVLYLPALFSCPDRLAQPDLHLEDLLQDAVICPSTLPVAQLIDRLQEARQELAVLADGDHVRGFVTITDAVESITGEVWDPLDDAAD